MTFSDTATALPVLSIAVPLELAELLTKMQFVAEMEAVWLLETESDIAPPFGAELPVKRHLVRVSGLSRPCAPISIAPPAAPEELLVKEQSVQLNEPLTQ